MPHDAPSRRVFLQRSAATAGGAWIALTLPGCREAARSAAEAVRNDDAPRVLTADEMRTLDALADRIIPADGDVPGASGARAVVFMDHYAAERDEVRDGLRGLLASLEPGTADLDPAALDDVVGELERDAPDLFGLLSMLTVVGTFGVPERGGNRDGVGWTMLGFDPRHVWQPPFGYYDAEATRAADGADR